MPTRVVPTVSLLQAIHAALYASTDETYMLSLMKIQIQPAVLFCTERLNGFMEYILH